LPDQRHEPQERRRHGCAAAGSALSADGGIAGAPGTLAGAGWHWGRGGIM
jgi:hypothetical protein